MRSSRRALGSGNGRREQQLAAAAQWRPERERLRTDRDTERGRPGR